MLVLFAAAGYGDYKIAWHTMDSGGGTSTGGTYQLTGTIGQPDAAYLGGGQYELLAGFWVGGPQCIVNLEDFAQFALYWLDSPCDESNNWCGGADLDTSGDVSLTDFTVFLDAWLTYCPYAWPLR